MAKARSRSSSPLIHALRTPRIETPTTPFTVVNQNGRGPGTAMSTLQPGRYRA